MIEPMLVRGVKDAFCSATCRTAIEADSTETPGLGGRARRNRLGGNSRVSLCLGGSPLSTLARSTTLVVLMLSSVMVGAQVPADQLGDLRLSTQQFSEPPQKESQSNAWPSEYEVSTLEAPEAYVRSTVGEHAFWLLTKSQLLKFGGDGQFSSVPVEKLKVDSYTESPMIVAAGSLWIIGKAHGLGGLHRLDLRTGNCLASIALGKNPDTEPRGISVVYGEGSLWILDRARARLARLNPVSLQTLATLELGKGYWTPPSFEESVGWTIEDETGVIKRIDTKVNAITDKFSAGPAHKRGLISGITQGGSYAMTVGMRFLWIIDKQSETGECTLLRLDPGTHKEEGVLAVGPAIGLPVLWDGYAWLSIYGHHMTGHSILRIDASTMTSMDDAFLPILHNQTAGASTIYTDDNLLWVSSRGVVRRVVRREASDGQSDRM